MFRNNMVTYPVFEKGTLRFLITQQDKIDYAIIQACIDTIKKMCIAHLKAVKRINERLIERH